MKFKGKTEYIPVFSAMNGPGKTFEQVMMPVKTYTVRGMKYSIPYEKKSGKVPESALYGRFLDVSAGSRDGHTRNVAIDLAKYADTMHIIPPDGFTPDELMATGWWQHPQESDILGIDDPSTSILKIIDGVSKSSRASTQKIAIIAPPDENDKIRKVLTDNFTGSELKRAVADGGIVIMTDNPGPGASGFYRGRQPGVDTPLIVLEPGCDEDTVTHEFVHHMRRADAKRSGLARSPFPTDEHGYTLPGFYKSKDFGNLSNLEEAATVAEAACRTRDPVKNPTGYYSYTDGKQPTSEKYAGDRAILISGKKDAPKRGYWATKKVEKEFGRTNISTLKYKSGLKAIEMAELNRPVSVKGDAAGHSRGRAIATAYRKGSRI